jgi:GNAT superfamily N-acetyltransferase
MIRLIRTDGNNSTFQRLAAELEEELKIRDGEDHPFYAQLNKIDNIRWVIVAYENDIPVGCGAIREYQDDSAEVKRMYVIENKRKNGFASIILKELEKWAGELNFQKVLLETGVNQPEAVSFYKKHNYTIIPNFGKYIGSENSICFEKKL